MKRSAGQEKPKEHVPKVAGAEASYSVSRCFEVTHTATVARGEGEKTGGV